MKNIVAYLCSIAAVLAIGFGFSSCKDDDPPSKPKLSFAETEMTVDEDDGNVEVELRLDKPHSKELRIEYALGGTASDQDVVGTANADYEVVGEHGVVKIPAGETSATIELKIYPDAGFEPDETIEIAIIDTNTDEIELTADDEIVITIVNDDQQLVASFGSASMVIKEDDGIGVQGNELVRIPINIPVQLDKAAPKNVTVKYSIKIDFNDQNRNDALDSAWAVQNDVPNANFNADYSVRGTKGELVIPGGATSANIQIWLRVDFAFDPDEEIEITLEPSSDVQVGTTKTTVVTIEEQDGKVIALVWDAAHTDVDLDLFLWAGADTTDLTDVIGLSAVGSTSFKAEFVHIPSIFSEGAFGLSYVYWGGTADPMNFQVRFIDFADNEIEEEDGWETFNGAYTLANRNPWDSNNGVFPPLIAHRFIVEEGVYKFGGIQVPENNSRMRPESIKNLITPTRTKTLKSGKLPQAIRRYRPD